MNTSDCRHNSVSDLINRALMSDEIRAVSERPSLSDSDDKHADDETIVVVFDVTDCRAFSNTKFS